MDFAGRLLNILGAMRTGGQQRAWDDLSRLDPYWAILSDPAKRFERWDTEAFLSTGREEVAALLRTADRFGLPRRKDAALEFGCGVGRVTRALAAHFARCVGVDISERMVQQARALNADMPHCVFVVNSGTKLPAFGDGEFDLVYTRLVLQHVPQRAAIRAYIRELVRVLAPGGLLVFQLPSFIPRRHRLQPRPRLYALVRRLGAPAELLYRRLGLHPMRMNFLPASEVTGLVEQTGGRLLSSETQPAAGGVRSSTYVVAKDD